MQFLREDTDATLMVGPFLDKTDGVTAETTVKLSAASAHGISRHDSTDFYTIPDTRAFTHRSEGMYTISLSAADVSASGRGMIFFSKASQYLPVWHEVMIVPANVFDSLFSTDKLQVDIAQCGGSTVAASAIPNVAAAANGGLPTVDASNYVAGMQGTKNTLDSLPSSTECATAVFDGTVNESVAGSTPTTFKGKIQAMWNYWFAKRTVTATLETAYESDNSTVMADFVLADDDTTASKTP